MSEPVLPPLRWIKAALRSTTETLARELVSPSDAAPEWNAHEWRIAQAVASIHGISPLLAARLPWAGPDDWQEFLSEQRDHTERRHARIVTLLERLDAAAKGCGLCAVALKGAALHAAGIYRPGERPMSDIDLLVRPRDRTRASRMLEGLGYEMSYEIWKHVVFVATSGRAQARIGEHADNPIKIELHTAIAEQLPFVRCDISDLVLPRNERPGLHYYRSTAALMAHVLLHAAGALALRGSRALQLEDIARLALRTSEAGWHALLALRESDRLWWAYPPLVLVARYYEGRIPKFVLDATRSACGWPLRSSCERFSLADVSLSDPHIHAFPGIEWSRTIGEAMRYMRARLLPDAGVLAMRKAYGRYQSLGADAPWVRQTQLERTVRWIAGQRLRVDTMACVRAAFAFDQS